jgi:hypothetical protein
MANTDNNTIALQVSRGSQYLELIAEEAIVPGMLIKQTQVAAESKAIKHDTADGLAENLFAVENVYYGKTIYDVYDIDSRVMIRSLRSGDVVLAWVGAGVALTFGEFLGSFGDGTLYASSSGAIAVSLEIDAGPLVLPRRTKVRII